MEKIILHSDLNNFYASVECLLNPALKDKEVAVCGKQEDRHGIVLAKNQLAKKLGVQTGEVIWKAKQKCKNLIIVPPQYEEYLKFSSLVKEIYYSYTDLIEPFGMDECWLDVTGSKDLLGDGLKIAESIRTTVKKEIGLTVSVGVSFNKIFAKLGSDMKKPDAITCITKEGFKDQIWNLPAKDLLGVGSATRRKLDNRYIKTIGDLASSDPEMLRALLGKNGVDLWKYANGLDKSRVRPFNHFPAPKSIGRGITCTDDLVNNFEVLQVITELSQDVSHRLRKNNFLAKGIQISIRDSNLFTREYQTKLSYMTQSYREISNEAFNLFKHRFDMSISIRSITVRAINLVSACTPEQLDIFNSYEKRQKNNNLEMAVESVRAKYGKDSIKLALTMKNLKMPTGREHELVIMPSAMYR